MRLILTGPLAEKPEVQQCSYFLLYIGQTGRDIHDTWSLREEEKNKIEILFDKFANYCQPKKNVTMSRFKFNSRVQNVDEAIDQFVTELKLLSNDCEFGELRDSLIRDRIICGARDEKVRERLLQEEDIPLAKAVDLARSMEISRQQVSSLTNVEVKTVKCEKKFKPRGRDKPSRQEFQPVPDRLSKNERQCQNCGLGSHPFSKCPARNKLCNYYKKQNHFSKMCRKLAYDQSRGRNKHKGRAIHEIQTEEYEEDVVEFDAITIQSLDTRDEIHAKIKVQLPSFKFKETLLKVKVDTGAQGNALPLRLYKKDVSF